ncbi:hypothetical protein DRO31_08280, partial [Candidatus Bathyarchaeota archaeon]
MKELVESSGTKVALNEVDIVTTGTMGAMCSSGALINVGHADPPIKIEKAWINDVPIPHPGAAVDLYIGGAVQSETGTVVRGDLLSIEVSIDDERIHKASLIGDGAEKSQVVQE